MKFRVPMQVRWVQDYDAETKFRSPVPFSVAWKDLGFTIEDAGLLKRQDAVQQFARALATPIIDNTSFPRVDLA